MSKRMALMMVFLMSLNSCSNKLTLVYYNDSRKVDDGEIYGEALHVFFIPDKNIQLYKIKRREINAVLFRIKDSLKNRPPTNEPDDGYYQYAFVTYKKDTLFADYRLNYWKYRNRISIYINEEFISAIQKVLNNVPD